MEKKKDQIIRPPLAHALYEVIAETDKQLFAEQLKIQSSIPTNDVSESVLQKNHAEILRQEAIQLLRSRLHEMLDQITTYDREIISAPLQIDNARFFKTATIEGTTFYTNTDVLALPDGIHKIWLFPVHGSAKPSYAKIPALLFVGEYRYFKKCFADAKFVILAYPGCLFTSTRGVGWNVCSVAEGAPGLLISQYLESSE